MSTGAANQVRFVQLRRPNKQAKWNIGIDIQSTPGRVARAPATAEIIITGTGTYGEQISVGEHIISLQVSPMLLVFVLHQHVSPGPH